MSSTSNSSCVGVRVAKTAIALLAGLALGACNPSELSREEITKAASLTLAALPPVPPDPTNRVADEPRAAAFGATLFFDPALSINGEVSCGTCHKIERQFQDDLPRGHAIGITDRRTMPLAGVAYNSWQFWDGRRDSLWAQAITPLEDIREHGGNRLFYVRLIAGRYRDRYERLFGPLPDLTGLPAHAGPLGTLAEKAAWDAIPAKRQTAINTAFANIGKAIAAFERTLLPAETRFDRHVAALLAGAEPSGDAVFSDLEREGLKMFIGSAGCLDCHNGPLLTDGQFHNTGVPADPANPRDRGRAAAVRQVISDPFNCLGDYSDGSEADCAELQFMVPTGEELERAFKTPSLRGVADRAPFMHAGQILTLEGVVDHYNRAPSAPAGLSELQPLKLTDRGRAALIAFLRTLGP